MSETDIQLLARYTQERSEAAFAELVQRHLALVFSAAFRQVRSRELAEEVAQSVFTSLACHGHRLAPDTVIAAWLYQVTRRAAVDVIRREARRQKREQLAMEMNAADSTPASDWKHVEPMLEEAMETLEDKDRAAVLLRFFENKSLREIGETIGTSEDAARKRVDRAIERLRRFFAKRGVAVGTSGLAMAISANALQAVPVGLAATISSAALLPGTAISSSTLIATSKTILMTTVQKTMIASTIALVAGVGVYEARQVNRLNEGREALHKRETALTEQIQQLQNERDTATNRIARLKAENALLTSNLDQSGLLKLRGEVGVLRQKKNELEQLLAGVQASASKDQLQYSTNLISKDAWQFTGYDTPEASLQSTLWAKSRGNEKVWLSGIDDTNAVERLKTSYVKGNTDEERSQFLISQSAGMNGFRVLREIPLGDDRVLLQFEFIGHENGPTQVSVEEMKKVDGAWKIFKEYN